MHWLWIISQAMMAKTLRFAYKTEVIDWECTIFKYFISQALDLVDFILTSLTLHEEEIQQIHLPMFLTALLCKAEVCYDWCIGYYIPQCN